ncbi:MAG TPA: AMP-binding protein [Bryobacteraceae bacterium]|nr:AMP-binding protein [Bryobacteraceae bacterium]
MKSMARDTLLDFFSDFADLRETFLVYDDGLRSYTRSYDEVSRMAHAFAARLHEANVKQGEKVLFYGENRPEWIAAFWGCLLAGVVVVPIDYRSAGDFVTRVAGIVNGRVLLIGAEVVTPAQLPAQIAVWPLSSLTAGGPRVSAAHVTRGDTAEIIFTSGATAEPKGVIITHANVLANIVPVETEVRKYRRWGRPFHPIRFLNLLPLSHMFGQAMATFIPPMLPGLVVFMRGYSPVEITRQIHSRRVSVLVSVPMILEVLREHVLNTFPALRDSPPQPRGAWYRRWWRYRRVHRMFGWKFWAFIVGAAPLPPDLEAFWKALGYVVIQGYGLTETAPIVTLNHPFHTREGSVGAPIAGVQVKIGEGGEILVRGENVTRGYYNAAEETARAFDDEGWFHTGDIGTLDDHGRLTILGRLKEMIVTPEGLNVFPEDVERVLDRLPGVRDSAVVGTDRVHAVLILEHGADKDEIVRQANAQLADHQKIRSASVWPYDEFPRTEGTRKLKRREIAAGAPPPPKRANGRYAADTPVDALSSLERVELMVATNTDEAALAKAKTVGELRQSTTAAAPPVTFPSWNRSWWARAIRRVALPLWLLPLTRLFAHIRVEGREKLGRIEPPVIFAPNHQSYMDVPVLMAALRRPWRYRVAPAMRREFFDAHFHPRRHGWLEWFTNSLNYWLSALFFNCFPIPQREAGAVETMRYMAGLAAEGWCIVIFPEGIMTDAGEIKPFQPGVGMLASRLDLPVIPVRIEGLDHVLHKTWHMAKPGRVRIAFGDPLRLEGDDYAGLARRVEAAVRAL